MLTRLVVALIRGPLLIFVSLSKVILLLVPVKHIMLSPVQVLKLNIELWLILLLRCYEFALFLHDLGIDVPNPMQMCRDNETTIFTTNNPIFHEHFKHIEVGCHFIQNLLMQQ